MAADPYLATFRLTALPFKAMSSSGSPEDVEESSVISLHSLLQL
jgi:hypothetical protein